LQKLRLRVVCTLDLVNPWIASVIARPDFKASPFPFYVCFRFEPPIHHTKLPDTRNVWLMTRYQDVVI
jgi:hypothetical protein